MHFAVLGVAVFVLHRWVAPPEARRIVLSAAMTDGLHQDYVRTATAKGLSRARVVYAHALRNALVPVVSIVGTLVPRLVGGSVVTEAVFGWPGIGFLTTEAISQRDLAVVTAAVLVIGAQLVALNLLIDLLYTRLDPRIRLQ